MPELERAAAPSPRLSDEDDPEPTVDSRDREDEEDEGAEEEPAVDPFDKDPGSRT